MKSKTLFFSLIVLAFNVFAKVNVVTTTTDLAAIVKYVGADEVEVLSIAKGTQDPHQIEAKPSFMIKLRSADVVFAHGLELESAWILPLVQGSRNTKLLQKFGVFELGPRLDPIDIPKGAVSRAEGDVHPGGNPHFQLDPIRLGKAALLVADRLSEIVPTKKVVFSKNAESFQKRMEEREIEWKLRIKKSGVKEIVTYHKSFAYFCDRFELQCSIQLEPKPGIPPTASHIVSVIEQMKKKQLRIVLIENLYNDSVKPKLLQEIPLAIIERVPVAVGGESGILTNEQLIERVVKVIELGSQ